MLALDDASKDDAAFSHFLAVNKTLSLSNDNVQDVEAWLQDAISNYHAHVADVHAQYVTPAGQDNCWSWTRENANHRLFHFSVARAGYMYWETATMQQPPPVSCVLND
jgi:cytochrome c oxidase assembly factor CtaG